MIGLGRERIDRGPADDQGRMQADRLPAEVTGPAVICAQAGEATDDLTLALIAAVQQDGTCWCGPTTWQQRPAMRISVCGWATSDRDIRQSAQAIVAAYRHAQES